MSRFILITVFLSLIVLISGLTIVQAGDLNLQDAFKIDKGPLKDVVGGAGYNPENKDINVVIGQIITIALSFLGVVFLLLMIYGGYLWMTAHGNEEQVKKARNIIVAAAIGAVIVISAYAISYYVIYRLSESVLKYE